ncbi:SurA N-terminal domain-containing protein [Alkalibacter mobilis]|uniref:SurA N-terminal domain-containing protein n=1 Tax=Alkalibacter mobilis TaxID=2787712 RepID=UPI0018A10DE7|nr:SurA N-terminal domain-containing protein [Alkalibacter mobilis]MBF7096934.1 SurA N-terminal domain-containing protein [Alkalibacter mobilis]
MKKIIVLMILAAVFMVGGCAGQSNAVAVIGEQEIGYETFNHHMLLTQISYDLSEMEMPTTGEDGQNLKNNILNGIIENVILVDVAKNMELKPDADEAQSQATQLLETIYDFYDEGDLEALLKEYELSADEFEELINESYLNNQLIFQLYDEVIADVALTEEETLKYYEDNMDLFNYSTVHVKGFVMTDQTVAGDVLKALETDGSDVDQVLEDFSNNEKIIVAADFGPVFYTDVENIFWDELISTPIGENTEVVVSEGVYYLGHVYGREIVETLPLEQVEDAVRERALSIKKNQFYEKFVQDEFEKIEVEAFYDRLK